jgi:hypothetical protein
MWYYKGKKVEDLRHQVHKKHTPATIQSRALRARYSTPPSSYIRSEFSYMKSRYNQHHTSICSSESNGKAEFLPTTASKEMYGTAFAPGGIWPPRCDARVVDIGIVTVLVNWRLNLGKNLSTSFCITSYGMGNPPKSLCIAPGVDLWLLYVGISISGWEFTDIRRMNSEQRLLATALPSLKMDLRWSSVCNGSAIGRTGLWSSRCDSIRVRRRGREVNSTLEPWMS